MGFLVVVKAVVVVGPVVVGVIVGIHNIWHGCLDGWPGGQNHNGSSFDLVLGPLYKSELTCFLFSFPAEATETATRIKIICNDFKI